MTPPELPSALSVLSDLPAGECAIFQRVRGGRNISGRLTSLGFTPGARILMIQNYRHGPLVVSVRGGRVALGREEARMIEVSLD